MIGTWIGMPLLGGWSALARQRPSLALRAGGRRADKPSRPLRANSPRLNGTQPVAAMRGASAGFAAVDALVALTIFAVTIALVLQGAGTARRLAVAASETREAAVLGQYLLETSPRKPGQSGGRANGFLWKVNVAASPAAGLSQVELCKRSVDLTGAESGRRYSLSTAEACPSRDTP